MKDDLLKSPVAGSNRSSSNQRVDPFDRLTGYWGLTYLNYPEMGMLDSVASFFP